jgi:hypothetical protein
MFCTFGAWSRHKWFGNVACVTVGLIKQEEFDSNLEDGNRVENSAGRNCG